MIYKVKLKNSDACVLIDSEVYEWLTNDPYFVEIDLIHQLRLHSSGCAVFQKTWKKADGSYKTETYYLHKIIAEKFLIKQKDRDIIFSSPNWEDIWTHFSGQSNG